MNPDMYAQHLRKLQADRLSRSRITTTSSAAANNTLNLPPPPAYTPSPTLQPVAAPPMPQVNPSTPRPANYYDDEEEDEDEEELEYRAPSWATNITVTAPVKVVGHGNILNTSSLMSMLGSSIAAALQQHQQQQHLHQRPEQQEQPTQSAESEPTDGTKEAKRLSEGMPRDILRPLNLNVNCGISIIGSRNIVGESLAKAAVIARATHAANANPATAAVHGDLSKGSKRKADTVSTACRRIRV